MEHYRPKAIADILRGMTPADRVAAIFNPSHSGTFSRTADATRTAPVVFGAPGESPLTVTRAELRDIISAVNADWQKQRAIKGVARAASASVNIIRRDKTLMDFALCVAVDRIPWRRPDGENIVYDDEGNGYKVRRIRKSGDIWVDYKAAGGKPEKWRWDFFRRDAIFTIAGLNPLMSGLDANNPEDFQAIILWFVLLSKKINRQGKALSTNRADKHKQPDAAGMIGGRKVFSRNAHLRLAAKHSALSVQTRILLGFIWCGANGYLCGRKLHTAAKMAARAAGLPEDRRFLHGRVLRILSLVQDEVWNAITARKMSFADFNQWRSRVVARLADGGHAAEFRLFMVLWHFCLSREKGAWRWRGWHKITAFAVRPHSLAARRMSGHARCHKTTARRALAIFSVSGLFSFAADAMVCVSPGYWGEALSRRIENIAALVSLTRRISHHKKLIGILSLSPQAP